MAWIKQVLEVLLRGPNRRNLIWFFRDLRKFKTLLKESEIYAEIHPYLCLEDRTSFTAFEPTYLLQDAWIAKRISLMKPDKHLDIGSSLKFLSVLAQFVEVTMLDIRPPLADIPNLRFQKASVTEIPLPTNSVSSLSCLCVLEHIGLGRYGDSIDPMGTEKSVQEVLRVMADGGNLYVSLPVDRSDRIYFNAHRAFTRDSIINLFKSCYLKEEAYQYSYELTPRYDPERGFGTGLFHFVMRKPT